MQYHKRVIYYKCIKNVSSVTIKANTMTYIFLAWKSKIGLFFLLTCVSDGARVGRVAVGGENFVCFNLFRIVLSVAGSTCKFIMHLLKQVNKLLWKIMHLWTLISFTSIGHNWTNSLSRWLSAWSIVLILWSYKIK